MLGFGNIVVSDKRILLHTLFLFGITQSVCASFLRFLHRVQMRVLMLNRLSSDTIPCPDHIRLYQVSIPDKHLLLDNVYAVTDRLKLYLEHLGGYGYSEHVLNG